MLRDIINGVYFTDEEQIDFLQNHGYKVMPVIVDVFEKFYTTKSTVLGVFQDEEFFGKPDKVYHYTAWLHNAFTIVTEQKLKNFLISL